MDFAFADRITDQSPSESAAGAAGKPLQVPPGVVQGMCIHKVTPVYPTAAHQSHIEGAVVLRAVIGKDGRILELHPVSGSKVLIPAAIAAVQQWIYKPYILNNQALEVETQITVNFTLSGSPSSLGR